MAESLKTNPNPSSTNLTNAITPLDCSRADTGVWLVKVIESDFKTKKYLVFYGSL